MEAGSDAKNTRESVGGNIVCGEKASALGRLFLYFMLHRPAYDVKLRIVFLWELRL